MRKVTGRRHTQIAWWPRTVAAGEHQHRQEITWPLLYGGDGEPTSRIVDLWKPTVCQSCGAPYDGSEVARGASLRRIWDTADGDLHPGDMYWADWLRGGHSDTCWYWDNCPGPHLQVVLPNSHHWDIDSRASNCTLPDERTHRCWIREGDPPNVTAGKAGHTCAAGAGSILSGDYHGFLRNGQLDPC